MGMTMSAAAREPFEGSTWRPNDLSFGLLVLCAAFMGCGEEAGVVTTRSAATAESGIAAPAGSGMMGMVAAPATPALAPAEAEKVKDAVPTAQSRKIIYNAQVELVVEDISTVVNNLTGLVKTHGGYVAETDVSASAGGQRRGMWKVRVPVDRFDALLAAVARLGEMQKNHVDSQDVTEEFYDIEARITNKHRSYAISCHMHSQSA